MCRLAGSALEFGRQTVGAGVRIGGPKRSLLFCVCGRGGDGRGVANEHSLWSHHTQLRAIINHLVGFIVGFTAHAQHLSEHAAAGRVPFD